MSKQEQDDLEVRINAHMDIARTLPYGAQRSDYISANVLPLMSQAFESGYIEVRWEPGLRGGKYRLVARDIEKEYKE